MESEEMPLIAIPTLISLHAPIQLYLSKVMGSRGGSPWKLSEFFKFVSEEHPRHLSAFMPLWSLSTSEFKGIAIIELIEQPDFIFKITCFVLRGAP